MLLFSSACASANREERVGRLLSEPNDRLAPRYLTFSPSQST